jgi:hypothetical protein
MFRRQRTTGIMSRETVFEIFARTGVVTSCLFTAEDVDVVHRKEKSGRHDSNMRPPAPKAGALARLSYAPISLLYFFSPEHNRHAACRRGDRSSQVASATRRGELSYAPISLLFFFSPEHNRHAACRRGDRSSQVAPRNLLLRSLTLTARRSSDSYR